MDVHKCIPGLWVLILCFVFRCQVQDKEVTCNEKEHIISELKEKVVVLNSGMRQLEMKVKDLGHQNMQV